MARREPATVTLTHPSGRFVVRVAAARAAVLQARGYTVPDAPAAKRPRATPAKES